MNGFNVANAGIVHILYGSAKGDYVIAVLDATNVVPEAREDNNVVVSPRIE